MVKAKEKKQKKLHPIRVIEKMTGTDPLEMPKNQAECLAYNTTIFHRHLKNLKATRVEISYSGGGDQGQVDSVTIYKGGKALSEKTVNKKMVSFYEGSGRWTPNGSEAIFTKKTTNLHAAMEYLTYDIWSSMGVDGFGNNEGGQGTITLNMEDLIIACEHEDNGEQDTCPKCDGSGYTGEQPSEANGWEGKERCEECGGNGTIAGSAQTFPQSGTWTIKPLGDDVDDDEI